MRVLFISLFLVIADQASKTWVKATMAPHESIPVVGDLFRFTFTENPGMAFGLTLGSKLFLTVFSVIATLAILVYLWRVRRAPAGYRLSLALILSGAVGNVIDRLFNGIIYHYAPLGHGNVIDFIHLDLWHGVVASWVPLLGGRYLSIFPIGNIADLAIIAGVVLLLFTQKRFHEQREREPTGETGTEKEKKQKEVALSHSSSRSDGQASTGYEVSASDWQAE